MKNIINRLTKRTLLSILIVLFSMMNFAATTYYVSNTTGKDTNDGKSTTTAWQTLAKVNSTTFAAGDQILFQKGDTFYGYLTVKNSGSSGSPITFGAYGTGENPIITGFTTVSAWTNLGGNIWESTNAVSALSTCNMVVINGANTPMGRFPNSGYLTFQSHSGSTSITTSSLSGTPNWTGADVVVKLARWKINHSTITSQSGGTLNYSPAMEYEPSDGYGLFVQNDIRTLDSQNEWYYNPSTKKISIYSTTQPTSVKVASVDDLVTVGGSYVTIDNITFSGSNKHGIYNLSTNISNLIVQNCSVLFSGMVGIQTWCTYPTIENCMISDSNSNAILYTASNTNASIRNCTVTNTGIYEGMGNNGDFKAISLSNPQSTLVEYNNILNTGLGGINWYSGNNTIVRYNYVDGFCKIVDDGGGIYAYISKTKSTITGNILINGVGNGEGTTTPTSRQAHGIYLDDQSAHFSVTDNTVANCNGNGMFSKGDSYTIISGNTTYNCTFGLLMYLTASNQTVTNSTINNQFICKTSSQMAVEFDYPANSIANIGSPNNNYYARPVNDTNPIRQWTIGSAASNYTLAQWQAYSGVDTQSKKSPQSITTESELQFEFNAATSAKTVTLSNPMIDVKGTKYSGSTTLQPFTSLVLMKDLTPVVVPGAPTLPVATAGNASASVIFVAPTSNGGSEITGYTVTSNPSGGVDANAGSTSLTHSITGLTNGTSYTFTVKATNSAGTSAASVASNAVTPKAPSATSFLFTGPSTGSVNSVSTNFTVTPNNLYTGTITLTPTGSGSAGLSAIVLTFSNSATAQTFTITPTVVGSITLTPTNSGTLTNPSNLTYTVNAVLPDAPTSVVATAGDASASVTFVAPTNNGGSVITGYTITSLPSGGIDTNAGSTSLIHAITGLTNGTSYTFTVTATNSVGSSVASAISNSIIPVVANVITKQGEITSHFTTVWQGLNGLNHMNINVVSAKLEDVPLSADDEIAVFSGSLCVGAQKLTTSIVSSDNSTFLTILASQSDGSNNGFTDNDTIVFRIWDNKTKTEFQVNGVVYRNDVSTWKTNGKYSAGATTVVEIESYKVYTQSIELLKGYNMISTYVSVQNPNVTAVTKTLLDQGNLIKMQDEAGNSYENWGNYGGWVNNLGSLEKTEGYKIQVANNCTLQVTGRPIAMPLDINLKTGWNIISFPRTDMVDAISVVQPLIDQNTLVKVQDEAGNSIENWGLYGGWKNGIGNFIPGKAYKVKVNADAVLTFQENYTKSAVVLAQSEETEYFKSSTEGNGTDHMNINITGLNGIGISVGDELAAFDGDVCVGTTKITEANLLSGSACLVSSYLTNDQNIDGFKVGDPIQISAWSKISGDESKVITEVITGQMKYEKNASVLVKMKSATLATAISNLDDEIKIDVFPNPCQGQVTVRFSEIPEANSRIEISDISGRKLISQIVSETSEEFNLESFTSGLYFVKSILGTSEFVRKLIVNK